VKRSIILLLLTIFLVLIDYLSKSWIHLNLPVMDTYPVYPYGGIGVFENLLGVEFSIAHTTNHGAAWGLFHQFPQTLLGIRILLTLGLGAYLILHFRQTIAIPLVLVLSGAIGNILDLFIYGHVIDFLHFILWGYDYPVFNFADSCIFVGVFSLILFSYFEKDVACKEK
jgi:signal peptidase II